MKTPTRTGFLLYSSLPTPHIYMSAIAFDNSLAEKTPTKQLTKTLWTSSSQHIRDSFCEKRNGYAATVRFFWKQKRGRTCKMYNLARGKVFCQTLRFWPTFRREGKRERDSIFAQHPVCCIDSRFSCVQCCCLMLLTCVPLFHGHRHFT